MRRSDSGEPLKALAAVLAWTLFAASAACDDPPPPQPAVAEPRVAQRDWPEPAADKVAPVSAAEGVVVPAGGVGGGRWALSPDASLMAHVGTPGEPNVIKVWSIPQGAWERQFLLPFYPAGPVGFSRDGRTLAVTTAEGGLWLVPPSGELTPIAPGPCEGLTHITSIPEGGWVVAGAGGCLARFKAGAWVKAPDTGIAVPLDLAHLTRGQPVLAGRTVSNRPAAAVWWPDGAPTNLLDEPPPPPAEPAAAEAAGAPDAKASAGRVAPTVGAVIPLKLPSSNRIAGWANVTPTLVGSVYLAMEGVPLAAYEPSTGAAVGSPMPTDGAPWNPPRGALASQDGGSFYAIGDDGKLYGGSTALWEADWEVEIPEEAQGLHFMPSSAPLLVIGGEKTVLLDVGRWASLPGPPNLVDRPWQPLELAYGNNGQALAVTYAAPSIGGTARWVVLWTFDGEAPRRVGLGTLSHAATWEQVLGTGRPTTPVAGNRLGTFFAAFGPTVTQLFETSTGVRAGNIPVGAGRAMAFSDADDALFMVDGEGALRRKVVRDEDPGEAILEARWPAVALSRASSRDRLVVGWGSAEAGGIDVFAGDTGKSLGTAALPEAPTDVALSSSGERALAAIASRGVYRWPGGDAVVKAADPADRFTAVAFHPRTGEATFAGKASSLMRWGKSARADTLGRTAGPAWDLTYHPLGRCVVAAVGGGRVEIWNDRGPIVTLELWEGGRWVMWTSAGAAVGTRELVDSLRVRAGGELVRPYMASTAEIPKTIARECE